MANNTPGKRFKTNDSSDTTSSFMRPKRSTTLRREDGAQKAFRVSYPKTRAKNKVSVPTLIISIVLVLIVFAGAIYFASQQLNKVIDSSAEQSLAENQKGGLSVEIPDGAGSAQIADILQSAGVISSKEDFLKAVSASGDDKLLKPGAYSFIAGSSLEDVIEELKKGGAELGSKLTIPEGLRVDQTAQTVEKTLGISADDFINQAKASNYVADYPFLEGAYNDSLEGFLFPKTYTIAPGVDADSVIRTLLDQFKKETDGIDFKSGAAAEHNLSLHQVITLASLIERETKVDAERPQVSQVIYNRLNQKMPLQVDAAIVYALGGKTDALTKKDLEVDSPYNIYKNQGLPPGPIASPSLASIKAALNPEESNNLYYVLTSKEGTHTFTESYEDFLQAKQEYKKVFGR